MITRKYHTKSGSRVIVYQVGSNNYLFVIANDAKPMAQTPIWPVCMLINELNECKRLHFIARYRLSLRHIMATSMGQSRARSG